MRLFSSLLISLFLCLSSSNTGSAESVNAADTVLFNAKVYTLDWHDPDLDGTPHPSAPFKGGVWQADADAIAIAGNKILEVGRYEELNKYISDSTEVIDLEGATVIPGLVDSHVHIAELGQILERINLAGIESPAQVIDVLKTRAQNLHTNDWLIGQGWDEGAWANNYPNRKMLDAVFPDNPVYLKSLHGFAVWVNSRALQLAGVDRTTQAPVGGEILRDEHGEPTGVLLNRATTLIADAVPKPSVEQFAESIRKGLQKMAEDGFVAVHEAGAETLHIDAFQHLQATNSLGLRVYAMLSSRDSELAEKWLSKGPLIDETGFLDIRSVKAYYDGALGSRGARLLADYSDKPGHRGVSGDGYGFDFEVVDKLIRAGFQVGIHAIGDAGNKEVLDFLAESQRKYKHSIELRHRVEHAQVIQNADFERFRQLRLIASMEPPHAVEDKTWAEERLGDERIKGAYAWRTLRLADVDLTFNSDLPGSDHSIFYGLHAAITRRDKQVEPAQGWYPEQNVSIEEAIRAYTSWAAYSAFREGQTGVIKAGNWADLSVMDIDPFSLATTTPELILEGNIVMTMVDGKVVFSKDAKKH